MHVGLYQSELDEALNGDSVDGFNNVISNVVSQIVPLPQPEWSRGQGYLRGHFMGAVAVQDFTQWVDEMGSHVESLECIGDWIQCETRFSLKGFPVQLTVFASSEQVSRFWAL